MTAIRSKQVLTVALVVLIAALVLTFAVRARQESRMAHATSTAAALAASLTVELNGELGPRQHLPANTGSGWATLTPDQYDSVVAVLAQANQLDAPRGWRAGEALCDPWGHRFRISIRRVNERLQARVSSDGPDGLEGTKDDVVRGISAD